MKELVYFVVWIFPFICLFILVVTLIVFLAPIIFAKDEYHKPDADDWE